MTTIAANRTHMAADSMATVEYSGFVYTTRKLYRNGETIFGASGDIGGFMRFLRWHEGGQDEDNLPEFDPESEFFVALALTPDGLFRHECSCFPLPVLDSFAATGDGAPIALAAMSCGKSPEEAVELACGLNPSTGPPVVVEAL